MSRSVAASVAVALAAVAVTLTGLVSAAAQPPPESPSVPVPSAPATPAPMTTPVPTSSVPPSRWVTPPPTTTPASPTPVSPGVPGSTTPGSSGPGPGECGVSNISGCVAKAIDGFFQRLVDSALNPLLDLLSHTLLTTPEPGELPQVGALWSQSWQLVAAMYVLVVMAAGVLLMVRETLQTRWSIRELAPRLLVGFIAGAMSMVIATTAIGFANALAQALAGNGVDSNSAAAALTELTATGGTQSGVFALLLMVALMVMLVVLLVAYVVRVSVTVLLIVSAPLALMCHGLPGTEAVARWWWRSFAACLAIQVVQSLTLVTVLRVFLTPGGWEFFGPNANGIVDLIVALALMGVLIKTPFWLLSVLRIGHGRSFVGSIARSYVVYKTFGLLKGGGHTPGGARAGAATPRQPRAHGRRAATTGPPDPYARVRATRDGQLMLPLEGVRRVRRPPNPDHAAHSDATSTASARAARAPRGRQLAFDFTPPDPYRGIRPGRDGQYPLPIRVTRVKPTPSPEAPRASTRAAVPRARRPEQLTFDFAPPPAPADPYERIRPTRSGQYPLPFPVTRVKPAPPTRTPPQPPPPPPVRSAGRQLHLPLPDLPVRRRAPRAPRGGKLR
ncbi:hypothetical protein [Nocardia abscessus]|uniref:hypothetical protein n=1 Tax=Nocardia abscessus TaxID=120957 RepID=UPI0024585B3B|nr:hypothetical protein [Nocardia abscessus]